MHAMISMDIRRFVNRQKLGYVATVSGNNTPNLSPKGTIIVWDSRTLAFADICSPNTIRNISSNPSVEINIVDPLLRKGFRFAGRARAIKEGRMFEEILAHYKRDGIKSSIRAIVLVEVSCISEVISPLYAQGLSEEEIKSRWRDYFLGM